MPPAPTLEKRAVWWWVHCASSAALLSLPVFVCFEFLGFPVECAEAGWLLEVTSHVIFTYSCYFGHGFCHFVCPKPVRPDAATFSTSGAILTAWGHLGRPWEQQEGHMGIQNYFLMIL